MAPLLDGRSLNRGQIYMVGRVENSLEGLEIKPSVSQSNSQTVVLLHLAVGVLPKPEKDLNLRKDIKLDGLDDDELDGSGQYQD